MGLMFAINSLTIEAGIDVSVDYKSVLRYFMHGLPLCSFPDSLVVDAFLNIVSSTTKTIMSTLVPFTRVVKSTHTDHLSSLPGDLPWVVFKARPLSVQNVLLISYKVAGIVETMA